MGGTILSVAALIFASVPARTQSIPLTNDHVIVVEHLIALHDSLSTQVVVRNREDPANAVSRLNGLHDLFKVSPEGYELLAATLRNAKTRLDQIRFARTQYLNGVIVTKDLDSRRMDAFYQEEQRILRQVPLDLVRLLRPTDWANLQSFIASELTAKIKTAPLTNSQGKSK